MGRVLSAQTWARAIVAVAFALTLSLVPAPALTGSAQAQGVADPYAPSGGRVQGDRWIPEDRGVVRQPPPRSEAPIREYDRVPDYARPQARQPDVPDRDTEVSPRRGRAYEAPEPREPSYSRRDRQDAEDREEYRPPRRAEGRPRRRDDDTYDSDELLSAGHKFFGSVSRGLARAIESVMSRSGRPNGYILGEDAGGAFVAGLRYGEGRLYTKRFGDRRVYWQGPTLGYDFGGEGSKVMVLVYNIRRPSDIYRRFGGVQGSAYLVGGVSVQFQKSEDIVLAPIRAGVGLRIGANVGYLKYTRRPTWNPF